jgi:hypothetical protein
LFQISFDCPICFEAAIAVPNPKLLHAKAVLVGTRFFYFKFLAFAYS